MAAKRTAKKAKPLNEAAEQGAAADGGIYLDPRLAEIREQEKQRNSVTVTGYADAELDPALAPKRK